MNINPGSGIKKDFVTEATKVINVEHANCHEGNLYSIPDVIPDISSGSSYAIGFLTPASGYVHYRNERISTSADKVTVVLQEGATISGGTTVSGINHNRTSANTCGCIIKTGITVSTAGTTISTRFIGGGTGVGATRNGDDNSSQNEYDLKQSTQYAIIVKNDSSGTNTVEISPVWYEEGKA